MVSQAWPATEHVAGRLPACLCAALVIALGPCSARAEKVETVQAIPVNNAAVAVRATKSGKLALPAPTTGKGDREDLRAADKRPLGYKPPAAQTQPKPPASKEPLPAADVAPGEILWSKPPKAASDAAPDGIQWSNAGAHGAKGGTGRLNSSGRTIELTMPLRDEAFYLGDVDARVSPRDEISIPKGRLLQLLAPILRADLLDAIKALPDAGGYVSLASLNENGFAFTFDPGTIELTFSPTIDQRATGELSAGNGRDTVISENLAQPALFAAYLNMRGSADYATQSFYSDDGSAGARIAFDAAARWQDVVLESSATFEKDEGISRGTTRFVYDMPERALRFSAGDVAPLKADFQGGSDLLGLSVEKSYRKLQPAARIRPTGSRSFRIERPSTVNVVVNGHVVQRLQLRPGEYDLRDLPLASGANDISLEIEDDVGRRRTLDFTVFSGRALLAPGISEWSVSAGVATRYGGAYGLGTLYSETGYDFSTPVITGFYERGLTPDLTGNVHLQGDPDSVMGGAGAAFQTGFGFWGIDAALSQSSGNGLGYATRLGYDLGNIEGPDGIRRSFRFAADYRSEAFAPIGIDDPHNDTMVDLTMIYSQDLAWDLSGSLSGNYSMGYGDYGDRYGVDLSLARNFGPFLSAGLSAGYQQSYGAKDDNGLADGFKAAVRLSYRLDENSSIDASHDARYERSQLSYRHQEGTGVGSWNAQVELERTPSDGGDPDHYGVGGSLGYIGNRAELSVSQQNGLVGLDTETIDQRTSVTLGTAIAFADGRVAVGRPISNGFAIVDTHENLPDSEVAIGISREARQASSDFLGPALVSDVSPYSLSRVAYDVSNLPVGYDLGAGAFDLYAGYKSGYHLTVGSDYTVTAFGVLTDEEGKPIPLLTGVAYQDGRDDGPRVTIFTNRAGRFGAQGLCPGRWIIEMATEPKTRFLVDIPEGAVGLVKLDTLKPMGNG